MRHLPSMICPTRWLKRCSLDAGHPVPGARIAPWRSLQEDVVHGERGGRGRSRARTMALSERFLGLACGSRDGTGPASYTGTSGGRASIHCVDATVVNLATFVGCGLSQERAPQRSATATRRRYEYLAPVKSFIGAASFLRQVRTDEGCKIDNVASTAMDRRSSSPTCRCTTRSFRLGRARRPAPRKPPPLRPWSSAARSPRRRGSPCTTSSCSDRHGAIRAPGTDAGISEQRFQPSASDRSSKASGALMR